MSLSTKGLLATLDALVEDPYGPARQEKEKGRKVVGITPMHFPEELVHASGALPVILQDTNEPITTGWTHIFPNFCGFARSSVDWAAKGKLDWLDAMVVSDICLMTRTAYSIVRQRTPVPVLYMWWPLEYDSPRWHPIVLGRLDRCRQELEGLLGTRIDNRSIQASLELYATNRRLLRELYQLRRKRPGLLRARQMQAAVIGGMVMPKEEHNRLLQELLRALDSRRPSRGKVRLFLSGHLCHKVKPDILDLVEEVGGVVVGDDLYAGYRYYAAQVPPGVPPMEALMRRYFDATLPCPTKCGAGGNWADHIIAAARESGAQGVVSLIPKFCEAHMFYYPYLKDRLTAAGVPQTFVETEHEMVSFGGVKTRIEAFVEMLRG